MYGTVVFFTNINDSKKFYRTIRGGAF